MSGPRFCAARKYNEVFGAGNVCLNSCRITIGLGGVTGGYGSYLGDEPIDSYRDLIKALLLPIDNDVTLE